jgi:hypothetical protein
MLYYKSRFKEHSPIGEPLQSEARGVVALMLVKYKVLYVLTSAKRNDKTFFEN